MSGYGPIDPPGPTGDPGAEDYGGEDPAPNGG